LDFGLILDQEADYAGLEGDAAFSYKGILVPRFSALLGDSSELFISAGLNIQNEQWALVPELLRAEFSLQSGAVDFSLGRMVYSDPLGFITDGYFDGLMFSFETGAGIFSAGAWYTGLLYKRRANIEMTLEEYEHNNSALDYNDLAGTYFAPRRILSALEWQNDALGGRAPVRLSLLGQFDLAEEKVNSQYLTGKITLPKGIFSMDLGGCLEFYQFKDEVYTAYAAEMGFTWKTDRQGLSILGRHSSGNSDSISAFQPLNTVGQRYILQPKLVGLSVLSLDYVASLHRTLSLSLLPSYFIDNYEEPWRFWGPEIYGELNWSPLSDIAVKLGGGAFLPSLGNLEPEGSKSFWQVGLNLILSLY
jgi:hypothetical protein